MKFITIFTPTYNRAYLLPRLYKSLCEQTCKEFEWLIVDDGSTDETAVMIKEWISEQQISINYIYQNNSGKMQAHNYAVKRTYTEWFICVDSDDYIIDTAVEKIKKVIEYASDDKCAGILAYKGKTEFDNLGTGEFPKIKYSTLSKIYKSEFEGDTTLVFKTDVLRHFMFPKVIGEKFITEAYIYDQIDQKYELFVYPYILTVCEYMSDGYSNNIFNVYFKNPISMMLYLKQAYRYEKSWIKKLRLAANFDCYYIEAKKQAKCATFEYNMFFILMYLPGLFLRYKRMRLI